MLEMTFSCQSLTDSCPFCRSLRKHRKSAWTDLKQSLWSVSADGLDCCPTSWLTLTTVGGSGCASWASNLLQIITGLLLISRRDCEFVRHSSILWRDDRSFGGTDGQWLSWLCCCCARVSSLAICPSIHLLLIDYWLCIFSFLWRQKERRHALLIVSAPDSCCPIDRCRTSVCRIALHSPMLHFIIAVAVLLTNVLIYLQYFTNFMFFLTCTNYHSTSNGKVCFIVITCVYLENTLLLMF